MYNLRRRRSCAGETAGECEIYYGGGGGGGETFYTNFFDGHKKER